MSTWRPSLSAPYPRRRASSTSCRARSSGSTSGSPRVSSAPICPIRSKYGPTLEARPPHRSRRRPPAWSAGGVAGCVANADDCLTHEPERRRARAISARRGARGRRVGLVGGMLAHAPRRRRPNASRRPPTSRRSRSRRRCSRSARADGGSLPAIERDRLVLRTRRSDLEAERAQLGLERASSRRTPSGAGPPVTVRAATARAGSSASSTLGVSCASIAGEIRGVERAQRHAPLLGAAHELADHLVRRAERHAAAHELLGEIGRAQRRRPARPRACARCRTRAPR